jgi:hypothetical protein
VRFLSDVFLPGAGKLVTVQERNPIVTTILILNAASSLVAAACIGVLIARQRRQASKAVVLPVYVTAQPTRRYPGW